MTTVVVDSSVSDLTDIDKIIESHNPFDRSLVVRAHDVWDLKFPDVPSINGHISDAIFQGIAQIKSGSRSVLGVTIRAEKGLGKTHLISRLQRDIKMRDDTFFAYLSETDYSNLDQIHTVFLASLAMSLKQKSNQEVMQWQELAALMISEVYGKDFSAVNLIKRLPAALKKDPSLIDTLTSKICQLKPDLKDPDVVQAILWTLSDRSLFSIKWLAGQELSAAQAVAMGLPTIQDSDRETRALGIASQILDLVGDYRTIVICFDEIEPKNSNSNGLTTPQVVSLLAKDLYSKIKRGILIMAVFPQTWTHQIKVMPQAESVIDRIGEKVFDLKYLNSDDVVNLLSVWLTDFYSQKGLTAPTPTYPFDERELRELGNERPIIRRVLQWCCENWKTPGKDRSTPEEHNGLHQVEIAFNEQFLALDGHLDDYLDNSDLVANALRLGFLSIQGHKVGSVKIEEIQEINTKAVDRGYLNFRIVGVDDGNPCKIGVSILQEPSNKYVSAGLKRLIDYKKFDFTRGCLVRSKAVKPNTNGHKYLNTLLQDLGGEWVLLKNKDFQPLMAILGVSKAREEYEVTQEQIIEFIQLRKIAENNYLIQEILSDPSGQIPNGVVDEDQGINLKTNSRNIISTSKALPALT